MESKRAYIPLPGMLGIVLSITALGIAILGAIEACNVDRVVVTWSVGAWTAIYGVMSGLMIVNFVVWTTESHGCAVWPAVDSFLKISAAAVMFVFVMLLVELFIQRNDRTGLLVHVLVLIPFVPGAFIAALAQLRRGTLNTSAERRRIWRRRARAHS